MDYSGLQWTIATTRLYQCVHNTTFQMVVTTTTTLAAHDVLLGRGQGYSNWSGNVTFRRIVEQYRPLYQAASWPDKRIIAQGVVEAIHAAGGRFVELLVVDSLWK